MVRAVRLCSPLAAALFGSLLSGCANMGADGTQRQSGRIDIPPEQPVPYAHVSLDQIMAWVPADAARTPGVAQATVHLTLNEARRRTEQELCAGTRTLTGPARQQVTPRPLQAPRQLGGKESWFYRLSRQPMSPGECPGVDRKQFQASFSRHLPDWMVIRPAHEFRLLHRGRWLNHDGIRYPGQLSAVAVNPAANPS